MSAWSQGRSLAHKAQSSSKHPRTSDCDGRCGRPPPTRRAEAGNWPAGPGTYYQDMKAWPRPRYQDMKAWPPSLTGAGGGLHPST